MQTISIKAGDILHQFKIDQIEYLEEYEGFGILGHHLPTGLEFFHLFKEDKENLFSFNFSTVPENNCGIPHIIEHSVLSGSKKFSIKDPFQAFLKGSVNTFLNAMTESDGTLFPAASVLPKDYFNLMRLYGDAVFHPLLTKEIFEQEACRIEMDEHGHPYPKGVVYNEMQGALSDNDERLYLQVIQALFADTPFQYYSGGIPKDIIKLKYEDFLDYYKRHYQPSNCKLFLYGNIETQKQLAFLDEEILKGLSASTQKKSFFAAHEIQRWDQPKNCGLIFPDAEKEPQEKKITAGWGWLLPVNSTQKDQLLKHLVAEILLGDNGSPLYRALIDSGWGEDLSPNSFSSSEFGFGIFSFGLRGIKKKNLNQLDGKLLRVLEEVVDKGIPSDLVEGFLRRFEFSQRKPNSSSPQGLRAMDLIWHLWKCGNSPFLATSPRATLKAIRKEVETTPRFFEKWIKKNLLQNNHRVFFFMRSDSRENKRQRMEIQKAVEEKIAFEQEGDKDYPFSRLKIFYDYQNKPDLIEALSSLPKLERSDFDITPQHYPVRVNPLNGGAQMISYHCLCDEIVYGALSFDVASLSSDEKILLPVLFELMKDSSTDSLSLEEVNRQLGLYFGSLYVSTLTTSQVGALQGSESVVHARFNYALLQERVVEGLNFFLHLITTTKLNDKKRLIDFLRSERNSFRSSLVPDSLYFARMLASSAFSKGSKISDSLKGLGQYAMVEYLSELSSFELDRVILDLERLRAKLLDPKKIHFCLICSDGHSSDKNLYRQLTDCFNQFLARLEEPSDVVQNSSVQNYGQILQKHFDWVNRFPAKEDCFIYMLPTDVNCNCMALRAPEVRSDLEIPVKVLSKLLSSDFLWNSVRMQGGAYGVYSSSSPLEGVFLFSSFRDPALIKTFEKYRQGLEFYAAQPPAQRSIDEVVITLLGSELQVPVPAVSGAIAFSRHFTKTSNAIVINRYHQLQSVTPDAVQQAAKWLLAQLDQAVYLSITSLTTVKAEEKRLKKQFGSRLKIFSV